MNSSQQTEFITTALKQPFGMALTRLETQKRNIPALREAKEAEVTGKCRWPVLHQLRLWLAECGEKP